MGLANKLITRIEQQAEALAGYRQLDDKRQTRIYELEGQLVKALDDRDKALADVQHWRQSRQDAIEAGELMQAEIVSLQQQLDELQDRHGTLSNECANDKLQKVAIHCELQAAQDEVKAMRQQLAEAQQPDVDAMRAECERLRKFADGVRTEVTRYTMSWASWNKITFALDALDAGTFQPAPVAETAEGGT